MPPWTLAPEVGQYVEANKINYMRSVKAIVDAYDGSVRLFRWDDQGTDPAHLGKDPTPAASSPSRRSPRLMSHLRYPEDMFKVQHNLLATYGLLAQRLLLQW